MELYGVALLPDPAVTAAIVGFQHRNRSLIKGPLLGIQRNLPHMSILQCPFRPATLTGDLLALVADEAISIFDRVGADTNLTELYYQPVGWLFAGVSTGSWGRKLQERTLFHMSSLIEREKIADRYPYSGYSDLERQNYIEYGYRYVGDAFRPHITVGRVGRDHRGDGESLPDVLLSEFQHVMTSSPLTFGEIVFYKAGEYGALESVVARTPLERGAS